MGLEDSIGYKFKNRQFLDIALTHKSYANEYGVQSNEKFEFLGDSILEFISSKYLYNHFKNLREGELSKTRATVVCEESLYEIAKKHNISKYIKLGHSEKANHGNERQAILADSIEAMIAAIYFDGGLEEAEKFIVENLKDAMEVASKNVGLKDYKTVLQEKLQQNGNVIIQYEVIKEKGPDHNKVFVSEVKLNGKALAQGEGTSKKHAEMEAAKKALENIK